jgi:hypothetical protein
MHGKSRLAFPSADAGYVKMKAKRKPRMRKREALYGKHPVYKVMQSS